MLEDTSQHQTKKHSLATPHVLCLLAAWTSPGNVLET